MGTGGLPKFTPILTESFDEIIGRAVARFTKGLSSFRLGGMRAGIRTRGRSSDEASSRNARWITEGSIRPI